MRRVFYSSSTWNSRKRMSLILILSCYEYIGIYLIQNKAKRERRNNNEFFMFNIRICFMTFFMEI